MEIRNPWGRFEYNGDWSDGSSKWTPALIKELAVAFDANDGKFWMSYDDFKKYFSGVSVCHLVPDGVGAPPQWFEQRRKGVFNVRDGQVRAVVACSGSLRAAGAVSVCVWMCFLARLLVCLLVFFWGFADLFVLSFCLFICLSARLFVSELLR